jgi:tetratricopeptide (TPR) repeat protein
MITTAPYHSTGYTKKARAYFFLAWPMLMLNKDIRPFASLAILNAKIAIERNANDAYAYDMLGNSYVCLARYGLRLEVDPNDYVEKALVAFKQSVKINENFPWAYNDIGVAINTVGAWNHENGKSPVAQLRNAIASFQRAIAIDQMYQSAYTGALRSYRLIVIHKISVGIDPAADVAESDLLAEQLLKMNNNSKPFYRNRVAQRLEYAGYLLKIGSDPDPVLKSALNDIAALRNIDLHDTVIHTHEAYAYQLLSMHNVQNSITPIPFAEKGMAAAQKCLEVVPDFANCIATYGSLRMIVWLWDEKNGDRISGNLSRYLDSLLSLRNSIREDPDVGCVIAEVAYAVAERTVGKKRSDALEAGSRVLSAVLVRASHFSLAHVLRGRLWLLAAADYKNPSERRLRLANARSSFLRAFELDPLLRRQYGAQLAETERRLGIASAELKN